MLTRPIQRKGGGDQQVCDACKMHFGSGAIERRERGHRSMWRESRIGTEGPLVEHEKAAKAEQLGLQKKVAGLMTELDTLREAMAHDYEGILPERILNKFQMMKINEEREKHDKMRGFVNRLLRALLMVERAHHPEDDDPATCICGNAVSGCDAWSGVSQVAETLYKWERGESSHDPGLSDNRRPLAVA